MLPRPSSGYIDVVNLGIVLLNDRGVNLLFSHYLDLNQVLGSMDDRVSQLHAEILLNYLLLVSWDYQLVLLVLVLRQASRIRGLVLFLDALLAHWVDLDMDFLVLLRNH